MTTWAYQDKTLIENPLLTEAGEILLTEAGDDLLIEFQGTFYRETDKYDPAWSATTKSLAPTWSSVTKN